MPETADAAAPGAAREAEITGLVGEIDRLTARLWHTVGAWDAAGDWQAAGAATAVGALCALVPLSRARAARIVRTARFLRDHAPTAAALDSGEIGADHVEVLSRAGADDHRDLYTRDEPTLLDAARRLRVDHLATVARRWRHLADDTLAATDATRAHTNRRLHASTTFDGALRLDGWLTGDDAAIVHTALDRYTHPDPADTPADEKRTPAQRRADALAEVCRAALDHPDTPGQPGAAIDVLIDVATLAGHRAHHLTDPTCDLTTGPAPRATIERLTCDALVTYLLTEGSVVLDHGRHRRTITPTQRRALTARDRGCVWPGCDRPPPWCDAHHLESWTTHLGPTNLDNLALVCRHHHRWLHEHHHTLTRHPDGTWTTTGPDPPAA